MKPEKKQALLDRRNSFLQEEFGELTSQERLALGRADWIFERRFFRLMLLPEVTLFMIALRTGQTKHDLTAERALRGKGDSA